MVRGPWWKGDLVSIPGSDQRVISAERVAGDERVIDGEHVISLDEASRQLELAAHDARVAFDCIALGNLDRAHTNALTARAAVDAAEALLRAALAGADTALGAGAQGEFDAEADMASDAQPDAAFEAFGPGDDETFEVGAGLPVSGPPQTR
jgi:hypothetical protein